MSRSEQEGEDPRPDPSRRDRYRHHDGASSPDERREEHRMRHRQNGDKSRNGDSLHEDRRRDEKGRHRKEDRGTRRRDEHLESPHCDERKAGRGREADSQDGGRREDRSRSGKDDRKRHREDDERDDKTQHGRERHSREEMDGRRANGDFDGEHRRRKEDRYGSRKEEHDGHRKEESKRDERGGSYKVEEADSRHRNGSKQQGKGIEAKETTNRGEAQLNGEKEKSSKNQPPKEMPLGRTGGVYVPPFKLAQMMKDIQDKSSAEYQRMTWDALRKSINGLVNKVNASNIKNILPELFSENLIRGRGLFARSCMKSQMASPAFTHVFAGLVAVVNTKFPELGELLLKRVTLQFRRALKRNEKPVLLAAAKFIAHLVNQQVAHELVALEVLMVLLETPTDDSVEVAVGFVKECGARLQDLAPQGLHGIFERFRGILHEGEIDKRVQFMIEGLFAIRKANFQGHPAVLPELDLVEQEDQFTHEISLSDDLDGETGLDIFKADPNFLENEKKYESVRKEILGEESEDDGEESENESDEDSEDSDEDEDDIQKIAIKDETETNLVNLRRTIYLTIMSSVDFEEAGHKLLKIKLEPGQEMELCIMLLECCSQERTYLRYYGLLGQRFCMINRVYQENFDECFMKQYSMIHRLETNKLRNVAKFFAHLLGTDALPWNSLGYIRLTEEDTTSSSRIFIKILFQELSEHLGLRKLNERLSDPIMQDSYEGIFPKDNPKNTRFAINFFTSIGLGGITDSLREHLKNMPRLIMQQQKPIESEGEESSEPSDSSTESETSSSETDSASSGSDTETESQSPSESDSQERRKRRKKK